MIKHWKWIH